MSVKNLLLSLFALSCSISVVAQTDAANDDSENQLTVKSMLNGKTSLQHFVNHYTIIPPEGYVLVDAENTKFFLVDICGNPESSAEGVIGCLIPDVDDISDIPYFFVVSDEMCGYIPDNDASTINYDELLKNLQKEAKEANEEYRKTHPDYPVVSILGWAEHPYYDKDSHTLYWGKLLDFQGDARVVNYDMRVLGKDGYVSIRAVGEEKDLAQLKSIGKQMLGNVVFDPNYTYNDFDEDNDHIAEWTIGGLIVGKVLTKVGFWALIAKSWKLILLAFVAIGAALRKFFRRKNDSDDDTDAIAQNMTES